MKYRFNLVLFVFIVLCQSAFSQAFTENFEGVFPRTSHPIMSFDNNSAETFDRNNKKYQLKWYLNSDSIINISYAINGSKSLMFLSDVSSFGARASVIFNNIDLRNFTNPVFKFKSSTGSINSIVKLAYRKKNQWQYINEPFAMNQDMFNISYVLNSAFLFDYMSNNDLDSVDIKIEGVSDNSGIITIDDVGLYEATGNMQVNSVQLNDYYGNTIRTELEANVLELSIHTSAELNPLNVTQFQFNTDNSTNLQGIDSAKLFYVSRNGNQYIDYSYQFGNTIVNPNGPFTINGNYPLSKTSNDHKFILKLYFNKNAVVGSIVNFKCSSVNIGSQNYIPTGTYTSKVLSEIIPVLNHANVSTSLFSNYRGLATANNSFQRSIFVYNILDFGSTTQNYSSDRIVGIQLKLATKPSVPITGQLKVYLKVGDLGTVTGQWASEVAKLQLVYDGLFTIPANTGFYTIPFNMPNLPINNSYEYELAYEWIVNSGTSTNLNYEVFSNSNGAFSSGSTSALPSTLASATARPLLRFLFADGSDRIPVAYPKIPRHNNIHVKSHYDLNYKIYSDRSINDSFNYVVALHGINSPIYTPINKLIKTKANSFNIFKMGNYTFNLLGYDTIYNSIELFKNDLFIINNIHTTIAFPFTSASVIEGYNYDLSERNTRIGFATNTMFLNKYEVDKRNFLNSIVLHIGNNPGAINLVIRPVILDSNNAIVYSGDNYTITDKDINAFTILPVNSFELNNGHYKIGIQYVQGDIQQTFLSYQNSKDINDDWSYAMGSAGQVYKLSNNIGLIIGFNSSSQSKALPELGEDRTVCKGYVLNADLNADNYLWNTGDASSSIIIDSSGMYIIRIQHTNSNIFYYDSVYLTVINEIKPLAMFDSMDRYSYCQNDTIELNLISTNHSVAINYRWYKNNDFLIQTDEPKLSISNASDKDRYHVLLNYHLECIDDTVTYSDTITLTIKPEIVDSVVFLNTLDSVCADSLRMYVNTFDTNSLNYFIWKINGIVIDSTYTNFYTFRNIKNKDEIIVERKYLLGCIQEFSAISDTFIVKANELYNYFEYSIDSLSRMFSFQSLSTNYTQLIWDFGDTNIDSSNNRQVYHQYTSDGIYKVSLIAFNDCQIDTFSENVSVNFTAVFDQKSLNYRIYPNPSFGLVFIEMTSDVNINSASIYDSYGKYLGNRDIIDNRLSLSDFSPGIYFIRLDNQLFKIIKLTDNSY